MDDEEANFEIGGFYSCNEHLMVWNSPDYTGLTDRKTYRKGSSFIVLCAARTRHEYKILCPDGCIGYAFLYWQRMKKVRTTTNDGDKQHRPHPRQDV